MRTKLSLASVVFALLLAGTARAALPKPTTYKIVPGHSIGGAELGENIGAAKKQWGSHRGKCGRVHFEGADPFYSCSYATSDKSKGFGEIAMHRGKTVDLLRIYVGDSPGTYGWDEPVFDTPLARFRTKKGIRLGSSEKAVRSAYPKAKRVGTPGYHVYSYNLRGPHRTVTMFEMAGKSGHGRVAGIDIARRYLLRK
jgi:hypothetical protein